MILVALMLVVQAPPVDLDRLSPDAQKPAKSYYQHHMMQPTCIPAELDRLRAETIALTGAESSAWDVAQTMLCGIDSTSRRYLMSHMPKQVLSEVYPADDYGGVAIRSISRAQVEMLQGLAWETTVSRDSDKLTYSYDRGGVCSGSFSLRHTGGAWLLVGVSEACD
jgi:hypothetical protein